MESLDFTKKPVQESVLPISLEVGGLNLGAALDLISKVSTSFESTGQLSFEDEAEVLEMMSTLRDLQNDPINPIDSADMRAVLAKLNDIYNKGNDASSPTIH